MITLLAAHAAIAIANARLHEETRELSIVAERNRLALDLHDAVSQKLFGLILEAEAAATVLDRDPAAARERVGRLQELARDALDELGSLVFELRPPDSRDGPPARSKHVEVLRRLGHEQVELAVSDEPQPDGARDAEVLGSRRRRSRTRSSTRTRGASPSASPRATAGCTCRSRTTASASTRPRRRCAPRRLGLTSMEERASRDRRASRSLVAERRHDRAVEAADG